MIRDLWLLWIDAGQPSLQECRAKFDDPGDPWRDQINAIRLRYDRLAFSPEMRSADLRLPAVSFDVSWSL